MFKKFNHTQKPVYLVDGQRTPFIKAKGKPGPFSAADLAVFAGRSLLLKLNLSPAVIDEVIVGCVASRPEESNIARIVAIRLGCDKHVPAWTVNRNCGSGMQAIDSAAKKIQLNQADLILAGGTEALSHTPLLYSNELVNLIAYWNSAKTVWKKLKAIRQIKLKYLKPIISLLQGLTDPLVNLSMGQTAENLAYRFKMSRRAMDEFSIESHNKLAKAIDEKNQSYLAPIHTSDGSLFFSDDGLRRDGNTEKLAKLTPVFDKTFGSVTAGNSSQVTDGASMILVASEEAIKKYNLKPIATLVDSEWAGLDPAYMGLGPVYASTPLLTRQSLKLEDIDYWEINEAFAAQVLACRAAWENEEFCKEELNLNEALGRLDLSKLNLDGGAIGLGHPLGASGARIVLHLMYILKRNQKQKGIATLCIGGGQGGALLIERVG